MNTEKTIKNTSIAIVAEILVLLLQFIGRRVFIHFLDVEFLGYHSLFSSIFSLLSVTEMGVKGIITFHLYKEFAEDNKEEIGKLMYLYKWIYRLIAAVVLVLGLLCAFAVPYVARDATASRGYLYLVYFMQLGSVVATYFLSYRRAAYYANQKEYKCFQIELYRTLVVQLIQIGTLALFRNYLVYLSIQILGNLYSNWLIARSSDRDYPYLKKKYKVTLEDIRRRNMFADVKNFFAHKISGAVYEGTDSIVISIFCGVRTVGLYGNYALLRQGMQSLMCSAMHPVESTIGNIVYSKRSKEELWEQFRVLDVFIFFFANYFAMGFLIFFQPAIQIWLGKEYLLPASFVWAYSVYVFANTFGEMVNRYRSVFGDFAQDRNCMLLSAALNIVVSVALVRFWGVTGVQIGTLVAYLPITYGRSRFVVKGFFGQSLRKHFARHCLLMLPVLAEMAAVWAFASRLPVSVSGLALRVLIWAVLPGLVGLLIFWRSPYFKGMCLYLKRAALIAGGKLKEFREKVLSRGGRDA